MYTLIIWSMLCTAADIGCETGDYLRLEDKTYTAKSLCVRDGERWAFLAPNSNRYACLYTENADKFNI